MHTAVQKKLKNTSGVTILLSLVVLMVAGLISAVLLSASTTSVKNVSTTQESVQEGVTLDSAALLLKKNVDGQTYNFSTYDYSSIWNESDASSLGLFGQEIQTISSNAIRNKEIAGNENDAAFTLRAQDMEDVKGYYSLKKMDDGEYLVIFTLKTENRTVYVHFNLSVSVSGTDSNQKVLTWKFDRMYGKES